MIKRFFTGLALVLLVTVAICSPLVATMLLFFYFYAPLAFGVTVVALWEVLLMFSAMVVSLGILLALYIKVGLS